MTIRFALPARPAPVERPAEPSAEDLAGVPLPGHVPQANIPRPNFWKPRRTAKGKIQRFREHLAQVHAKQGAKAAWDTARDFCKRDIFYLGFEVLGYKDMSEVLHDDLCDFLVEAERANRSSVVLVPRSHFKSTIATITRCIWWIINDPNVTVGLVSANLKNSRKFLKEIRNHLEKNVRLRKLFPEIFWWEPRKRSPKWTEFEIQVNRTSTAKEPTIKAFGLVEGLPTGDHFGRLIVDDAVDQETVKTEGMLEKVNDQIKYLRPLRITVDQPIHWVGTRYHLRDPYGKMVENAEYLVYHRRVVEDGEPIFPERFSLEDLEKERIELGNFIYACQYEMEPGDPADKKFRAEWLKYGRALVPEAPGYYFFLTVDPANQQKKKSDFTAMLLWAVDWNMNIQLVDGVHDKLDPHQRIEAVLRLYRKWQFLALGYEVVGFQATDAFWLKQRMQEENLAFRIQEINSKKESKNDRIEGLQPIMKAGKFWLPSTPLMYKRLWENPDDGYGKEIDLVEQFKLQMDFYPFGAHDDLLDAAQMIRDIIFAPGFKKPDPPPPKRGSVYPYAQGKKGRFNPAAR